MKCRLFLAILLIAAAWAVGRVVTERRTEAASGAGRDEFAQTYELAPGARVEVRAINGSVRVEAADTQTAEVRVVRTASSADALESARVVVEQTGGGLVVRGERNRGGNFFRKLFGGGNVRQEVTLRVPRGVSFEANGINGYLTTGDLGGPVAVHGTNGSVELAQGSAQAEVTGVNGVVQLTLSSVSERGVSVSGVNGGVEFRLRQPVNADVRVNGNNGGVSLNVPNVTSQERPNRTRMNARLGAGGPVVSINGVNGGVSFSTVAPSN